jgi:hypothetical protein
MPVVAFQQYPRRAMRTNQPTSYPVIPAQGERDG